MDMDSDVGGQKYTHARWSGVRAAGDVLFCFGLALGPLPGFRGIDFAQ
jgi:hypothetical protein